MPINLSKSSWVVDNIEASFKRNIFDANMLIDQQAVKQILIYEAPFQFGNNPMENQRLPVDARVPVYIDNFIKNSLEIDPAIDKVTKRLFFNESGQIEMKQLSDYNSDQEIERFQTIFSSSQILTEHFKYENGKLKQRIVNNSLQQQPEITEYEYNADDKKDIKRSFDIMGQPKFISKYHYNENGRLQFREITDKNDHLVANYYYSYTDEGNLTEMLGFMLSKDALEEQIRIFGELDNPAFHDRWKNGAFISTQHRYDAKGNRTEYIKKQIKVNIQKFINSRRKLEALLESSRESRLAIEGILEVVQHEQYEWNTNSDPQLTKVLKWNIPFMEPKGSLQLYRYFDTDNQEITL